MTSRATSANQRRRPSHRRVSAVSDSGLFSGRRRYAVVARWSSGNDVGNEVTLRLVLRWVNVCWYTVSVGLCNQPLTLTQPPILRGDEKSVSVVAVLCGWEGNRRFSVTPVMRHPSTGGEHPVYTPVSMRHPFTGYYVH